LQHQSNRDATWLPNICGTEITAPDEGYEKFVMFMDASKQAYAEFCENLRLRTRNLLSTSQKDKQDSALHGSSSVSLVDTPPLSPAMAPAKDQSGNDLLGKRGREEKERESEVREPREEPSDKMMKEEWGSLQVPLESQPLLRTPSPSPAPSMHSHSASHSNSNGSRSHVQQQSGSSLFRFFPSWSSTGQSHKTQPASDDHKCPALQEWNLEGGGTQHQRSDTTTAAQYDILGGLEMPLDSFGSPELSSLRACTFEDSEALHSHHSSSEISNRERERGKEKEKEKVWAVVPTLSSSQTTWGASEQSSCNDSSSSSSPNEMIYGPLLNAGGHSYSVLPNSEQSRWKEGIHCYETRCAPTSWTQKNTRPRPGITPDPICFEWAIFYWDGQETSQPVHLPIAAMIRAVVHGQRAICATAQLAALPPHLLPNVNTPPGIPLPTNPIMQVCITARSPTQDVVSLVQCQHRSGGGRSWPPLEVENGCCSVVVVLREQVSTNFTLEYKLLDGASLTNGLPTCLCTSQTAQTAQTVHAVTTRPFQIFRRYCRAFRRPILMALSVKTADGRPVEDGKGTGTMSQRILVITAPQGNDWLLVLTGKNFEESMRYVVKVGWFYFPATFTPIRVEEDTTIYEARLPLPLVEQVATLRVEVLGENEDYISKCSGCFVEYVPFPDVTTVSARVKHPRNRSQKRKRILPTL
jgi:hypothetical protein